MPGHRSAARNAACAEANLRRRRGSRDRLLGDEGQRVAVVNRTQTPLTLPVPTAISGSSGCAAQMAQPPVCLSWQSLTSFLSMRCYQNQHLVTDPEAASFALSAGPFSHELPGKPLQVPERPFVSTTLSCFTSLAHGGRENNACHVPKRRRLF